MASILLSGALYWDARASKDGTVYHRDDSIRNISTNAMTTLHNIAQLFGSVTAISNQTSLATYLFAYDRHFKEPLVVFVVDNSEDNAVSKEIAKLVSGQLSHIPGMLVILSEQCHNTSIQESFHELGANAVLDRYPNINDLQKVAFRANEISKILHNRTEEVKGVLGLKENEIIPLGSRFQFAFSGTECASEVAEPMLLKKNLKDQCTDSNADCGPITQTYLPSVPLFKFTKDHLNKIKSQVAMWDFYAQDMNYDDLLLAAFVMIKHAFSMDQVSQYKITDKRLWSFLFFIRNSYHKNPYHNFRHAVDVLQATFHFLLSIGGLPSISNSQMKQFFPSKLIPPVAALTLLIVALGHDAGHPGVSNAFMVSVKAPLAKAYHEKSVLEYYHASALVHLLYNLWPELVEEDSLKELIISSVLATDMGMHYNYVNGLNNVIGKMHLQNDKEAVCSLKSMSISSDIFVSNSLTSSNSISESLTTPKNITSLLCCCLIKCADISNVARKLDISLWWGGVLADEFSVIGELETEYGLRSKPFMADKGKASLEKAQIFFVKTYALPLFSAICKIFPQLRYTLERIDENTRAFQRGLSV